MTDEQAYLAFLEEIEPDNRFWFIHMHQVAMQYGGPEEGGWWYDSGIPVDGWIPALHYFDNEEEAYAACRHLNLQEYNRQKSEEDYDYTSVLAYLSTHYAFTVEEHPVPYAYPERRPHYE